MNYEAKIDEVVTELTALRPDSALYFKNTVRAAVNDKILVTIGFDPPLTVEYDMAMPSSEIARQAIIDDDEITERQERALGELNRAFARRCE